jgi:RNA polymerase sigma-70 factor (ECF subfamily)
MSLSTISIQSNHEPWLLVARNAPCYVHQGMFCMDKSDQALVMRAKGGDRDAFTAIFMSYRGEIYKCLMSVVRNDKVAEDLFQDTYVKALSNIQGLREPSRFRPWVLMIAKRLALDWHRQNLGGRTVSLEGEHTSDLIDENADPQLVVEKDSVQSILTEMDPVYQNVLLLRADGYSRAEIARLLKLSVSTVTTYQSRARKQFLQRYHAMSHIDDNISSEGKKSAQAHDPSGLESLDDNDHSQAECDPNKNQKEI